ncbi:MAG: LUD domain-containing protein [Verrucomicrobiae bacterium]|nr:LUD domain-containing protein [Verrucomicrobiae bacterium]
MSTPNTSARESMLGRIREALKTKAPPPGHPPGEPPPPAPRDGQFRPLLPAVGASWDEQCRQFARNAELLKAAFKVLPDTAAARAEVQRIAREEQWRRLATHEHPLLREVCRDPGPALLFTDRPYAKEDLEQCEGAVTACEALIAQTGSVLVTSRGCGGRAVSILPPHHLVVARREQLLPDLLAAFALLRQKYGAHYPSMISFITGPSRTGDIERILVLGAHGPKRLTILLIAGE